MYAIMTKQVEELLKEESWHISVFANVSALLFETMENINWAGFYIVRNGELTLGPFQGKVACIHIGKGKGVCGTAWDQFPGHIACDSASRSEIVIPVHRNGEVFAVLDIDSPVKDRFGEKDKKGLEQIVKCIEEGLT